MAWMAWAPALAGALPRALVAGLASPVLPPMAVVVGGEP
jgi:hypothetical protein